MMKDWKEAKRQTMQLTSQCLQAPNLKELSSHPRLHCKVTILLIKGIKWNVVLQGFTYKIASGKDSNSLPSPGGIGDRARPI